MTIKDQTRDYVRTWHSHGTLFRLTATVRHDDRCGNGHNTFSVTGVIDRKSGRHWLDHSGGCIHDDIAKHVPELATYLKWHLCSTDGPMHYIANTVYQAGDRDHWGLRKGEFRQSVDKETGRLLWELDIENVSQRVACNHQPDAVQIDWKPIGLTGEGKERDLKAARESAIWPDATDEELTAAGLEERLAARLPALLAEFQAAVESLNLNF